MIARKYVNETHGVFCLVFLLAGCQGVVPVKIKPLAQPEQKVGEIMLVGDLARNVRKEDPHTIGYHTFTILALRTVPIRPTTPPGMQDAMTEHTKKALRTAGYDVVVVPPGAKPNGPVLRGEIRKFWFSSYWWFWPITCVGGDIKLQLILESPQGKMLWEKECKGGGFMVLPSFANVDFLVEDAATKVCNQVIQAVTSEDFRNVYATDNDLARTYDVPPESEKPTGRKLRGYRGRRNERTGEIETYPVYEDEQKK